MFLFFVLFLYIKNITSFALTHSVFSHELWIFEVRLMDSTSIWHTETIWKQKAFAAEGHVHMCCQRWGIQAGILVNRDILSLGRDTKRLPTDLRQHLDNTFCSDHVSIIMLLKTQSHPQTAWVIRLRPWLSCMHVCSHRPCFCVVLQHKMLFGKPTTLFIVCPVHIVNCNPLGLWVVL